MSDEESKARRVASEAIESYGFNRSDAVLRAALELVYMVGNRDGYAEAIETMDRVMSMQEQS